MAAKFILRQSADGKYNFRLVAPNGQVIAISQSFERKSLALSNLISARENFPTAEVDDQTDSETTITES
jgi:uncharacterized protein